MYQPSSAVILITGATSGFGKACADHLHALGYRVYGTGRSPAEHPASPFELIAMDVTDDSSVRRAIEYVLAREGRIDVVVNNAGFGLGGSIEDTSPEEAQAQLDTNVIGVLRVCRAVLPIMRRQGRGRIINISSIGGLMGLPFQGMYCASKYALEGMSEALAIEVRGFGIDVVLVEPGDFRTGFTAARRHTADSQAHATYQEMYRRALAVIEHDELHGPGPDALARLVARIIRARRPRLRYLIGVFYEYVGLLLRCVLPARWWIALMRRYYRL
ncbi:MAG: SDR family oxidoreductase [Anaerolineae bacterium]